MFRLRGLWSIGTSQTFNTLPIPNKVSIMNGESLNTSIINNRKHLLVSVVFEVVLYGKCVFQQSSTSTCKCCKPNQFVVLPMTLGQNAS